MMGATDLYDAAAQLLAVCVGALGTHAPTRQYVSPGLPSLDCDQLVVYVPTIQKPVTQPTSPPTVIAQRTHIPSMNWATFMVICVRCMPASAGPGTMAAPLVAQLNNTSHRVMQDVWILWNAITKAHKHGTLFPPLNREVQMDPAIPLSPQGGVAGYTLNIQVQMNGYDPYA